MKKNLFVRAAALSLALMTALTACAPRQGAGTPPPMQSAAQTDAPATLGQIADYLIGAADGYNKTDRTALPPRPPGSKP